MWVLSQHTCATEERGFCRLEVLHAESTHQALVLPKHHILDLHRDLKGRKLTLDSTLKNKALSVA